MVLLNPLILSLFYREKQKKDRKRMVMAEIHITRQYKLKKNEVGKNFLTSFYN